MEVINPITSAIVKNAMDGETIKSLSDKIGFAYSAVYKWIMVLKEHDVIYLIEKGNRSIIKVNKNNIYRKFIELNDAVAIVEKDRMFWDLIKNIKLKIRFIESTAIVVWTQGSYITGDFLEKIYFLEVYHRDLNRLKKILKKQKIDYSEKREMTGKRPVVYLTSCKNEFRIKHREGLPVVPLQELVRWCKKLHLENVLEQLDSLYSLNLSAKYSEIKTNMR